MKNYHTYLKPFIFTTFILYLPLLIFAQNNSPTFHTDTLLSAARDFISETSYCALITLDTTGHPNVRTMDPFLPDTQMVIWLGTNVNSRKVNEIKNDPRVTLYYADANGRGYVLIKGHAYLIDDPLKKQTYWKKEWEQFYSAQKENYILIKVVPHRVEILDLNKGIVGDPGTWAVPCVEFSIDKE